jgi:hypothetical protein
MMVARLDVELETSTAESATMTTAIIRLPSLWQARMSSLQQSSSERCLIH